MFSTKKVLVGLGAGVSVAAIVIAGPAGAASAKSLITGTDIKDGTIHRADLAPALVGKLKGQRADAVATGTNGPIGVQGPQGDTGAASTVAGPQGPQGPKGDPGKSAGISAAGAGYAGTGAHAEWPADDAVH